MDERWGLYGRAWEWYTRAHRSDRPRDFILAWVITDAVVLGIAGLIIWATLTYLHD